MKINEKIIKITFMDHLFANILSLVYATFIFGTALISLFTPDSNPLLTLGYTLIGNFAIIRHRKAIHKIKLSIIEDTLLLNERGKIKKGDN